MPVQARKEWIAGFLHDLSGFSSEGERLTRQTFSEAWESGVRFIGAAMKELGMTTRMDGFGNLIGRYDPKNSSKKPIGMGSHADTVTNGGAYDGALGIAAALEAVRIIRERNLPLSRPVEVIVFAEEEGGVFGKGCLGSEYMTGGTPLETLAKYRDSSGENAAERADHTTFEKPSYGSDFGWAKGYYRAFYEIHAEQGDVLDRTGKTLAIVDGVVGILRSRFTFTGQANHAGTTEMSRRKDAAAAMADFIVRAYEYGMERSGRIVVTNGKLGVEPNQHNVIPGRAFTVMEMRSDREEVIQTAWEELQTLAMEAAGRYKTEAAWETPAYVRPISFDAELLSAADRLAEGREDVMHLFSWAGHDAKLMAKAAPSMMFFVPSRGGYSHCPEEYSDPADIAAAVDFLVQNIQETDA